MKLKKKFLYSGFEGIWFKEHISLMLRIFLQFSHDISIKFEWQSRVTDEVG